MNSEDPAFQRLLRESEAFQRLWTRHQRYEQQLADIDRVHHLTPEQELERKNLQKLKLAGKDQMMELVRAAGGR
jgi:uncharacterized protein YdcH (DUF465 family)